MTRLQNLINDIRLGLEDSFSDLELAAAITSGDAEIPEWVTISESSDHLKLWDAEEGGSRQMGFIRIEYSD